MNDLTFESQNKNGDKVIYHTIATYNDPETNKNFIFYTDNTYNDSKKLNIYYSLYIIVDNKMKLIEINDKEDKKTALNLLKELLNN